jgi:hypothetical protein
MIQLGGLLAIIAPGEEAGTAVLNLAVGLFAAVLLALSLNAYRRTRLRRLLLVSAAFGFFAASVAARNIEIFVLPGVDVDEVMVAVLELLTLFLFFLALVLRD